MMYVRTHSHTLQWMIRSANFCSLLVSAGIDSLASLSEKVSLIDSIMGLKLRGKVHNSVPNLLVLIGHGKKVFNFSVNVLRFICCDISVPCVSIPGMP